VTRKTTQQKGDAVDDDVENLPDCPSCAGIGSSDMEALREAAKDYLSAQTFVIQLLTSIGGMVETARKKLPRTVIKKINSVTEKAVHAAYSAGVRTLRDNEQEEQSSWKRLVGSTGEPFHKILAVVFGAVGGSFGMPALVVELPATTTLILRSIAEIAQSYGEDPTKNDVKRACLEVLAMGGPALADDDAELGYWSARLALTDQALTKLLDVAVSRFGFMMSEKVIAQAAPIVGAAGGAFANYTFMQFYQRMAHCHFKVRKLEKRYDQQRIRACFQQLVCDLQ
jgi:hypothetical protein